MVPLKNSYFMSKNTILACILSRGFGGSSFRLENLALVLFGITSSHQPFFQDPGPKVAKPVLFGSESAKASKRFLWQRCVAPFPH